MSANQPEPSLRKLVTNRMSLLQVEDHHIHGISQADEARLEHYIGEVMALFQADKEAAVREAREKTIREIVHGWESILYPQADEGEEK